MVLTGDDDGMTRRDMLLAALVACIWGFNFVVLDWGMGDVPPLLFAAIRFTLVALPAGLLVRRPSAPWRTVVAVGVFMSLGQFGFLYASMHAGMPPGLAALQPRGVAADVPTQRHALDGHQRATRPADLSPRRRTLATHRPAQQLGFHLEALTKPQE